MEQPLEHILVLGGGSAGWLTAGLLAAEYGGQLAVTLVESPAVPTIGVGEGTWPTMRETLRRMGVAEGDFFRQCDVSCKQGTKFVGWRDGSADDFYYHPFTLPAGFPDHDIVTAWQGQAGNQAFAAVLSPQQAVCEAGLAPKQAQTPDYAGVLNYAYHLNAAQFGAFLQRHCVGKLGVRHLRDHVHEVVAGDDGTVRALATGKHGLLRADLFIDCSGAGARLLGEHWQVPRQRCGDVLFNDRALAAQVPYPKGRDAIASATVSTALSAGWVWDIGLPSRRGVGYVYSSAHCPDARAEAELRDYLAASGVPDAAAIELRQLTFDPGWRQSFWQGNCVAVGMAAGFVEPLEASALVMVELSAAMIRDQLPATRALMPIAARRFNELFRYRWERIVEFLKLHYVLSGRRDSDYWRDHRDEATVPQRLRESLALWKHRAPIRQDLGHVDEIFPIASYLYILYGMGFRTAPSRRVSADEGGLAELLAGNERRLRRLLTGLPANRDYLRAVHGASAVAPVGAA